MADIDVIIISQVLYYPVYSGDHSKSSAAIHSQTPATSARIRENSDLGSLTL